MRLAVVIPSYNHARYIGLALDSCLNQTRKPDRIVVIDDGSRDDSLAVLETYKQRGVEVLARENRGAHNTINQAVAMAATDCDFISILNSDDHYHLERFATCLPQLASAPEKSVICTGIRVIDSEGRDIDPSESRARWFRAMSSWHGLADATPWEWLGLGNFPATTSNVIARREFLLRFPFRPYRFNHDYYFLAQTVLRDQMLVRPEPLVNYRVHASNTINTNPAPLMREMLRMHLDLLHDLAPELPGDPALRSRLYTYLRRGWDNVSAFHAGMLQALLAQLIASRTEDEIEQLVAAVSEADWPELREYPNKALVNHFDDTSPLARETGSGALAEKFSALQKENRERKTGEKAWKELARLQQRLADSKWAALGRLLGIKHHPEGTTPTEKLASLQKKTAQSRWLKLGRWKSPGTAE